MDRVVFEKGAQKSFLDNVVRELDAPSLRSLNQFGINVNYSSLKNYYSERRCIPLSLFETLCILSKINKNDLNYKIEKSSWGQIIGGKKSKRN